MAASYYTILEVLDTASLEVIKGAYKHLAQKWHPDKNPDNRAFATKRTAELTEAYRVLSDVALRDKYDESLKSARQSSTGPQYASSSSSESSGKTGQRHPPVTIEPRAASRPNVASDNRGDEPTTERKNSKTFGDFCFGAIFIGFLLFIPVGLVFQSSFSSTTFWITYAGVSLIAGFLWKHDFKSKDQKSSVHDFADGVGLDRGGHGTVAVAIGIVLLIGGKLAMAFEGLRHINGTNLLMVLVLITSIWVFSDAKQIGVKKGRIGGFADLSPVGWFFSCLLLWIIAFPLYLAKRPMLKRVSQRDD